MLAEHKAIVGRSQVAGDLLHPRLMGTNGQPREVYAPAGHFHDHEQVIGDQAHRLPR